MCGFMDTAATWLRRSKIEPAFLGFLPQCAVPMEGRAVGLGRGIWKLDKHSGFLAPRCSLSKPPRKQNQDVGGFFLREINILNLYLEWYSIFYIRI